MIITCPTCETRYTLADSSVGPQGRRVRCAKCGHIWWQEAPEEEPDPPEDTVTEVHTARPAAPERPPAAGRAATRRALVGWGLFLAALGGILAGGYAGRTAVVWFWPPAALLYETIGLPVEPPGAGLQFRNVRFEQTVADGTPVLVIDGEVVNVSDVERPVPPMRLVSLGEGGKPLRTRSVEASAARLPPGEAATFRDAQPDPGAVQEVSLTFEGG